MEVKKKKRASKARDSARNAPSRATHALLLVLLAAAALLRLTLCWRSEVWLDEANGILLALAPLKRWPELLALDSSPPLYYLVLRVFASISLSPTWLRLPSLLAGTVTVWLVYLLGTQLHSRRCGLVAAAVLLLSPLHVFYSGEIRMYAVLGLLACLFFLVVHVRPPAQRWPWGTVGLGLALLLTHHYAVLFVAACLGLALLLPERRRMAWRSGLLLAVFYIPFLGILWSQLANPEHIAWIRPFWESYPRGAALLRSVQVFLPGGTTPAYLPIRGLPAQWVILSLPLALLVAGLVWPGPRKLRPTGLLAATIVLTLAGVVAVSYVFRPVYLAGRSDVIVLPLFACLLALAYVRLPAPLVALALAVHALLGGAQVSTSWSIWHKPGNEAIAAAIENAGCSAVLTCGLNYAPTSYYALLFAPPSIAVHAFPPEIADHPGNFDPAHWSQDELRTAADQSLSALLGGAERPCVLLSAAPYAGQLGARLTARTEVLSARGGLRSSVQHEPLTLVVIRQRR